MLRVAIVEDEELQRRQLVTWLSDEPDAELVAEAADGESAVRMIDETRPDVVLLDVALPEYSGFEVLDRIVHAPEVVFTTAHREHAISAFELGAVDYLLKPFARERLSAALQRVRARERVADDASRSASVALAERVIAVRDDGQPLERLFVRDRGAIIPVSVSEIVRLEADGDYTAVVTAMRRHLVAVPLGTLHERIRRADFVRVHRQHVVNLAHVARLLPHDAGRFLVEFRSGGSVVASRNGSHTLRSLVE